ncbi:hypothetical protein IAQ61_005442 [Plenodomus lingam]|uniref:Zn(2)-C6 fungal-type domain-containing protein n=1 Tax=Leptosphaeria maculans (strain JN3 / isolate v23.1.3 / race Av1-4-5-6-7-8) TaxID=985895 RepID=E4ZZA1_LEPMJ|nr:hypothetical protein LEMA_P109610.1 [Plenodomus lingam JN3]KAH9871263.1 hypothetical protein IAQ61_005442 [Plenodomus lingam]CBX96696.1 hypothetical protein LEMA_P109610.1 [Plenodomus lingam JN3]
MVYRGKPSAACAECRKRRNRCDYQIPSCGQCIRAGRTCSGYRDPTDLIFHDETEQVARKSKQRVNYGPALPAALPSRSSSATRALIRATTVKPLRLNGLVMQQSSLDLGIKFFMSNYVGDAPALSMLNYLPDFYSQAGYASPELQQGIVATGLAGFSKATGHASMSDEATKRYISAIRGINGALTDPKRASLDATLMAIIMSAIFEIITSSSISATRNCSKHLAGAVSVASLMLKREQTVFTQRILGTLIQCVIMNCQINNEPPPPGFAELKAQVGGTVHQLTVHETFLDIIAQLADFELTMTTKELDDPAAIIEKADDLDGKLREFAKNMPTRWQFEEFHIKDHDAAEFAHEGYLHVYPQRFTALLWNNIRSMRIRLHQVILRQYQVLGYSEQLLQPDNVRESQDYSVKIIIAMARDLLRTIPQLTGYLEQLQMYFDHSTGDDSSESKRFGQALQSVTMETADNDSVALVQIIPHDIYDEETKGHTGSTVASSPSSSSSSSSPSSTGSAPGTNNSTSRPRTATLFHTYFQLCALRSIPHLPDSMKDWIHGRIIWIESIANAEDVAHLRERLRKTTGDGIPEIEGEEYVMQTYDFSRKLQIRPENESKSYEWSRHLMW